MALHNISSAWKLVISIFVCEAIGISSGLLSSSGVTKWFITLNKPAWNPPSWLFGPVWTLLYCMMGIAWWLVWKSSANNQLKLQALYIFIVQLALNFIWSILFFKFHQPMWAFVEIIVLWLAIVLTMYRFSHISKLSAWLLLPYLLWVSFASYLNFTIWILNK